MHGLAALWSKGGDRMAVQLQTRFITPEEYLALERAAENKSEYYQGEIIPMAGASRRHNLIVGNIYASLHGQLRKRDCEVYASDMRVKVRATGLHTYPDVIITCGALEFEDDAIDTLLTPTVIVEVLSKSTKAYDRGDKFEHYRAIDSLTDYIMVAQDKPLIEHFARQPDNFWLFSETRMLDQTVRLASVGCELRLADIYEKVQFGKSE
jgi:Uma2 family endonuclease